MNVDKYVTDEVVDALWPVLAVADTGGYVRGALRAVLPGILAQHKQDLLYALAREAVCLDDHDMLRAEAAKAVKA